MRERIKRAVEWWQSIPAGERARLAEYVDGQWTVGRTVPKDYKFPVRELARLAADILTSIDVDVMVETSTEQISAAILDVTDEIIAKHGAPPPLTGKTRPDSDDPKISEVDPDVSSRKSVDYGEP